MSPQIIIMLITLVVLAGLGFAMSLTIKQHDKKQKNMKKKKGRNRYMPEVKRPGR